MKHILLPIGSALVTLLGSAAMASGGLADRFAALHRESDQAFEQKNLERWKGIYDPVKSLFVDHMGKQQTLAQVTDEWREQFPLLRGIKSESTIGTVSASADNSAVVVRVDQRIQLELDGRSIKRPGMWIPLTISDSVEETWREQGGVWKAVSIRTLRHSQDIDKQWLDKQTRASSSWNAEDQRYFFRSLDCMRGIGYNCGGR